MSAPISFDKVAVLVEQLAQDPKRFSMSNNYFKNNGGLNAVFEIRKFKAELLDFAKDPTIKDAQLGPRKPQQPDVSKLTEEEAAEEIQNYRDLIKEYNTANLALKMQVPVADMFAIEQYMEPFEDTIHATPAVKGRRFHAFTKDPSDEQRGGLFGLGKSKSAG